MQGVNYYNGIKWMIDESLEPNEVKLMVDGIYHCGVLVDMQVLKFQANLTDQDLRFLLSLHISPTGRS